MFLLWPLFTEATYDKTLEEFYDSLEQSADVTIRNDDEVLSSGLEYDEAAESLRAISDALEDDVHIRYNRDLSYTATINGQKPITVEGSYAPR